MKPVKLKCDFDIVGVRGDIVFIVDLDRGHMSVTNDAENVVKYMHLEFPNFRIVYRDSMGRWDELVHEGCIFKGFKPWAANVEQLEGEIEQDVGYVFNKLFNRA